MALPPIISSETKPSSEETEEAEEAEVEEAEAEECHESPSWIWGPGEFDGWVRSIIRLSDAASVRSASSALASCASLRRRREEDRSLSSSTSKPV